MFDELEFLKSVVDPRVEQAAAASSVDANAKLPAIPAAAPVEKVVDTVVERPVEQVPPLARVSTEREASAALAAAAAITKGRHLTPPEAGPLNAMTLPSDGAQPRDSATSGSVPIYLRDVPTEQVKSLKCQECGSMNYPTEWYCERCGGELAAM
jgi:hypothetical protein